MKKLNTLFLLLLVAGMHSLFAQDVQEAEAPAAVEMASPEVPENLEEMEATSEAGDQTEGIITVKVTPSVSGKGRIYFSGDETRKGHNLYTDGDAKGRVKFAADYDGIGGAVIELEGELNSAELQEDDAPQAVGSKAANIGFGKNAYAYAHVLQAFGVDAKIFDVYLKSGRFNVGFDNAQDAGQDEWKANVGSLGRDDKINMQLDLKIMDMLTVRYGTSFAMIDSGKPGYDMGWGLLFDKSFGDHNLKFSAGYVVDFTDNTKYNFGDKTQKTATPSEYLDSVEDFTGIASFTDFGTKYTDFADKKDRVGDKRLKDGKNDWDNLGISVAYTGTFGTIKIMPFANLSLKGLLAHPATAYVNPLIGWSAGLKFQLRDDADKYDLVGLGLDLGGEMRENNNYYEKLDQKGEVKNQKYTANKAFSGFGLAVWTHALRSMMGDNYLSFWATARFDLNQPDDFSKTENNVTTKYEISREGYLGSWGLGLTQRFVNQENAAVALSAAFGMENIAPFYIKDRGYVGSETSEKVKHAAFKTYLDISLNASFTSVFKQSVK